MRLAEAAQPFPIHGGRSNEGRLLLDGLNVGSPPAGNSAPAYTVDVGNAQEVTFSEAGAMGEAETAGLVMNIVPRAGGNTTRGSVFASGTGEALQADNLTQALKDRGLVAPTPLTEVYDISGALGGPIVLDRVWYFINAHTGGSTRASANVHYNLNAGDPAKWLYAPDVTRREYSDRTFENASARVTWQVTPRNKVTDRAWRRWLAIAATIGGLGLAESASAADRQPVLVLYATGQDAQIAIVGDRELPRILENGLAEVLDYYSEFIEQGRFSQTDYLNVFRDFLRLKYAGKVFDLVIAMGDTPFDFVERYRDVLFQDTPVRFLDPSVWDRYKVSLLVGVSVLLAQAVLIAGLLRQREKRRRAELGLQASQDKLRTSYDRIRDLGRRLLDAQEGERSRIARELHDDIGQKMAVLTIDLQLLSQCGPARPTDAARLANGALDRAQALSKSVRALSHRLHPENLRLIGLVPALSRLRRELSTANVAVTFSHDGVPAALPPDLTLCLFRIAQEAVQNAVAHSHAAEASIRLIGTEDGLVLTVADNGTGFDVDRSRVGIGLVSMGERAAQVGATLQIRSQRGGGTCVEVGVPSQRAHLKVSGRL